MSEKIAFFDIDHTILKKSSGDYLIAEAWKRRVITLGLVLSVPWHYLRYRFALPAWGSAGVVIDAIKGLPLGTFRAIAASAFTHRYRKEIFPAIESRIAGLRRSGAKIWLATSSVDVFVAPLARHLKADGLVASQLEFKDGKSTGRFAGRPVFGAEKLRRVKETVKKMGIPLSKCSFYSDSFHDLPLLEAAGKAVAVNPDHRLEKIARQKGWEIIRCRL